MCQAVAKYFSMSIISFTPHSDSETQIPYSRKGGALRRESAPSQLPGDHRKKKSLNLSDFLSSHLLNLLLRLCEDIEKSI